VWKKIPVTKAERKQVEQEIAIGMKVKSPFLMEVLDTFEEEGDRYIVMELCADGSLREYMEDRKKYGMISEKVFSSFHRKFYSPLFSLPLSFF
jgi:serine/threonine protein kinase